MNISNALGNYVGHQIRYDERTQTEKQHEKLLINNFELNFKIKKKKKKINSYLIYLSLILVITKFYIFFQEKTVVIFFDLINLIFIFFSFFIHNLYIQKENSITKNNLHNHNYHFIFFLKFINNIILLIISILIWLVIIYDYYNYEKKLNDKVSFKISFFLLFSNIIFFLIIFHIKKNRLPENLFYNEIITKKHPILNEKHITIKVFHNMALLISLVILKKIPNVKFLNIFLILIFSLKIFESIIKEIINPLKILFRIFPKGFF